MFDFLFRLLQVNRRKVVKVKSDARSGNHSAPDPAFARLNHLAPIRPAETVGLDAHDGMHSLPSESASVVCREAILNRQQRVAGYEFMLRKKTRQRIVQAEAPLAQIYDEVLLRNILNMQIDRLLGHRLAFIPTPIALIDSPLLAEFPKGVVFTLSSPELLEAKLGQVLERLAQLKRAGYLIALADYPAGSDAQPLFELANFVVMDVSTDDLAATTENVRTLGRSFPEIQLVARNVDSIELFQVCSRLPFQLLQGPFVTSRDKWEKPRSDSGRIQLLKILNRIRQGAETAEMVELFKQEPVLSYKLLRYINSPAGGLMTKATSVEQAILLLGQQKLFRWLTMLLFVSGEIGEFDYALLDNAVIRARLTELLGRGRLPPAESENLFVVGMFSLLDVLLHMPMPAALAQLTLPEAISQAILQQQGPLAPFLALAIACEETNQEKISKLAAACGLSQVQVNASHVEALLWANALDDQPAAAA